jgi:hypothetical protein
LLTEQHHYQQGGRPALVALFPECAYTGQLRRTVRLNGEHFELQRFALSECQANQPEWGVGRKGNLSEVNISEKCGDGHETTLGQD